MRDIAVPFVLGSLFCAALFGLIASLGKDDKYGIVCNGQKYILESYSVDYKAGGCVWSETFSGKIKEIHCGCSDVVLIPEEKK